MSMSDFRKGMGKRTDPHTAAVYWDQVGGTA